jgi:thiosulfate dehydrogenase [quinone] large subunit
LATRRPIRPEPRSTAGFTVSTAALVPLRIFLGGTFVYAGLDKLLDPTFLAAAGPGSIGEQLVLFARTSPLAFLINGVALHAPVLVGLGMAVLEIGIGLGALTGWLFRLSAGLGAAVSILFWLTASWSTTPYFYGPDLPYAAGWLTLALAGTGGAWTLPAWFEEQEPARRRPGFDRRTMIAGAPSEERRRFLQLMGLAGGTLILAGPSLLVGRIAAMSKGVGSDDTGALATASPTPVATAGGTAVGTATPGATATPASKGTLLAQGSQLASAKSVSTYDPATGDPVLVIKLPSGSVVAYDAVCTHAGCTVQYDPGSAVMWCPCHGAEFDPAHHAQVLGGPTNTPLASIPITVDPSSGDVSTRA